MSEQLRKSWVSGALPAVSRFAARASRASGLNGKVTVLLASSAELRSLNRRFRGKNKITDVLAFPSEVPGYAGDIAISAEVAERQARSYQHSPVEEIKILVLHAMLHLVGYDHESDDGAMQRRENRLRRQLGLHSNLIARTEGGRNGMRVTRKRRT